MLASHSLTIYEVPTMRPKCGRYMNIVLHILQWSKERCWKHNNPV